MIIRGQRHRFPAREQEQLWQILALSAREPGAKRELAEIALERLEKLQLIVRDADTIHPRPALARFALGAAEISETRGRPRAAADLPFGPI